MAEEQNVDNAPDVEVEGGVNPDAAVKAQMAKERVSTARSAMRDAAEAMRDFAKVMQDETVSGMKAAGGRAVEAATKAAERADEATGGASVKINDAAVKAAYAAGDAMEKAYDAAGEAADQAFDAAQHIADDSAEFAGEAAERMQGTAEEFVDKAADAAGKVADAAQASAEDFVSNAKEDAAMWQDKFMRLHAEWDTYRRRTNEQREQERQRASEGVVESLLPVMDDFERTIDYASQNGEKDLLGGVQAVHAKFVDVLKKDGVEVIDPANEAFDALEAQAVGTVDDTSIPEDTVVEVYQKGYKMGGKVIRPAMVTVSVGGPKREPSEEKSEESDK